MPVRPASEEIARKEKMSCGHPDAVRAYDAMRKGKLPDETDCHRGLDGSGKATQTAIFYQQLQKRGIPVKRCRFPIMKSRSPVWYGCTWTGVWQPPGGRSAYAASSFSYTVLPVTGLDGKRTMKQEP